MHFGDIQSDKRTNRQTNRRTEPMRREQRLNKFDVGGVFLTFPLLHAREGYYVWWTKLATRQLFTAR